ncbi:Exoribonuclease II, mitochondrial [Psilocybe cubensis]|uniref:RNB domain-containing protein n=2 Tax=Psilocybe cubensis TaxID=181762 RepID=A0A8H7XZQ6_PSICU|nr:Exoribonuclease II, mitochondrial [Psilocybe cubensis]KAH9481314.1 Exoribonuclease II, mitochondrial [Psilocybe cubensis]
MHRCLRSSLSHFSKTPGGATFGHARRSASSVNAPSSMQAGPSKHSPKTLPKPERPKEQVGVAKNTKNDIVKLYDMKRSLDPALEESGQLAQIIAEGEDEDSSEMAFLPGTFVEIRKNDLSAYGIVLGEVIEEHRYGVYTLTTKGMIISHFRADVYFAFPNVISASLAERCDFSNPTVTTENNSARVEALKKLRVLVAEVEKYSAGMLQRPMNVYVEVMSNDKTKWSTTTVSHVANLLYERPSFMDFYMTHKMLMDQPLYYIAKPGYLKNQAFAVRPRQQVEEIETVTRYIYDHRISRSDQQTHFKRFVSKASKVVKEFERRRDSGPISQEKIEVEWDVEDRIFINFLIRSLQPHRSNQLDPYTMGRTEIVRAIFQPTEPVNDDMTHQLLIKLGIFAPWHDLHEFVPFLNPWGDLYSNKHTIETEANEILKLSHASTATTGSVLGPMDLIPSDPLESVRHDFGNARVFVIDDLTAQELDDGFSVERIPSEPDNCWIHVHIADPASVIHPNHALVKLARQRGSSYYLAHKTIPLFPVALVHDPKYSLSLQSRDGESTRVLTFSTKVDKDGNILDYKVRGGLIRNVKKISYDEVDMAIGHGLVKRSLPFGGTIPSISVPTSLDEADLADIKLAQQVAQGQIRRRMKKDVFIYDDHSAHVRWDSTIPPNIVSPTLGSNLYHGYPDMTYEVYTIEEYESGSRLIIAEMMKLANRTASRVVRDHNLPVLRRTMDPPIFSNPESKQEIMDLRSPSGHVLMQEVAKRVDLNPVGMFCLEPKQHYALGIEEGDGYARATSPLRRFEDIVCHWQLHHILLGSQSPRAPFSVADIEAILGDTEMAFQQQKVVNKSIKLFYSLMYIKRFADDVAKGIRDPGPVDPLASMSAWTKNTPRVVTNTSQMSLSVNVPHLGVTAQVDDLPFSMRNLPVGSELRVKFKSIDLGIKRTKMVVSLEQ